MKDRLRHDYETVLVTGSTGHVGCELARQAHLGGLNVRALVRSDVQSAFVERNGWVPVLGDLSQPASLAHVMNDVDYVIHSAAYGGENLTVAKGVNVEGTRALATLAHKAGVKRFVHISTMSVHGEPMPDGMNEDSPLSTTDTIPYCATKAQAELALKDLGAQGLETVILRPGAICNVLRSQWGNEMIERLRSRGWPEDLHPGDILPWVHTSNLAEMAWLSLTNLPAANETFIAVDRNVSVGEFFVPIANALGRPVTSPDREPIMSRCKLGKIAAKLGYEPVHSFDETINVLVEMAKASR